MASINQIIWFLVPQATLGSFSVLFLYGPENLQMGAYQTWPPALRVTAYSTSYWIAGWSTNQLSIPPFLLTYLSSAKMT